MADTSADTRLQQIHSALVAGQIVEPMSVRSFIAWFGSERRTYVAVARIRTALKAARVRTVPDFDGVYIDSQISFTVDVQEPASASESQADVVGVVPLLVIGQPPAPPVFIAGATADPAFRVGRLSAANRPPLCVAPGCSLGEAVTLMLRHDFSQLPVMTNERDVKGIISWETIGARLALKRPVATAQDCMKLHHEVGSNDSLFKVIALIVEHSYVLVRGEDRKIMGIVTTTDLSLQFQQSSEPFLLLSEIENHIRLLIDGRFTADELASVKDSADATRVIASVSDLTFGEYIRLLENPAHWAKTGLEVDRAVFVRELDQVRRIRNEVMHFDPDGITSADHDLLRHFVQFMHELRAISG